VSQRSGLQVRPATVDDLPEVCKIVNHYIENSFVNFRTEPQTVDEWRNDWRRLHAQFPWLVAAEDGVVGVAYAAPFHGRAAYQWTAEATVYVDPSSQRRGAGDALYTDLLARLRRQGFHSAVAVIALPNEPSVRLHERHGFIQVGRVIEAGYKLGAWHDVGFWQRTFNIAG
jgi:phosphinothricin acetyltransferase